MPRGGYRLNAGGKPTWKHGKTKTIRVPEALAEKILEFARILDDDQGLVSVISTNNEPVTKSKVIDLSGVLIRAFKYGPGVYLVDLLRAGYEIQPEKLVQSVRLRQAKENREQEDSLKHQVNAAIEDIKRLEGQEPLEK
jgi:hypothetical protein